MREAIPLAHAHASVAEGEFLLALPAIRAAAHLADSLIDSLPWGDVEVLSGYCIDRSSDMPAGSLVNDGFSVGQRCFNDA